MWKTSKIRYYLRFSHCKLQNSWRRWSISSGLSRAPLFRLLMDISFEARSHLLFFLFSSALDSSSSSFVATIYVLYNSHHRQPRRFCARKSPSLSPHRTSILAPCALLPRCRDRASFCSVANAKRCSIGHIRETPCSWPVLVSTPSLKTPFSSCSSRRTSWMRDRVIIQIVDW